MWREGRRVHEAKAATDGSETAAEGGTPGNRGERAQRVGEGATGDRSEDAGRLGMPSGVTDSCEPAVSRRRNRATGEVELAKGIARQSASSDGRLTLVEMKGNTGRSISEGSLPPWIRPEWCAGPLAAPLGAFLVFGPVGPPAGLGAESAIHVSA